MNKHFTELAKETLTGICMAIVCGGFTACKDDYDLDDEGNYPDWLGGSIYETLSDPSIVNVDGKQALSGTFNNYLKLINDLGYTETMSKTGSKTIFPANDEAFKRFYANNPWNVKSYDELTKDMKNQLLYGSMLDNALLVEMLSNIPNGTTAVTQGQAMKHQTSVEVISTIAHWKGANSLPANNSYWQKYADKGINVVTDGTRQMMVHFTEEQMTTNAITTEGENSDFEVVTGTPYHAKDHSAYIFRNKIISPDITCKNGYIHQMQDVLVPPGNLAQLIRNNGESNYFSRMLDRFSAPFSNMKITKNYNDYAQLNSLAQIDTIFEMRYMSHASQGSELNKDPDNIPFAELLPYDPGWNEYNNGTGENVLKDVAAMFVPTDEALSNFFLPGGEGEFLINQFGKLPNTQENLAENIDSIPLKNINQLVSNLMKKSFVNTVPSKFGHVMDEASDPMGLSLDVINKNSDGSYDVKIANNGVAYMLNKMFAPPSLVAVSSPVTLKDNMKVMNELVYDGKSRHPINMSLNYYAYLLAMSANYAFFIPTDEAFNTYYVNPATLNTDQPEALRFFFQDTYPYIYYDVYEYNPNTQTVGAPISQNRRIRTPASEESNSKSPYMSQLIDILNYHTIVLGNNETLGANGNKYYKTKHGGAICYTHGSSTVPNSDGKLIYAGGTVTGGAPVGGNLVTPNITEVENKKNGVAYSIDHIIQAPQQSVLDVLSKNSQFKEFLKLCQWTIDNMDDDFTVSDLMEFASDKMVRKSTITGKYGMDAYRTFLAKGGLTDNVNYFNSYNYTVFAPNDEAMQKAYNMGLPTWNDVKAIYDEYAERWKAEKSEGKNTKTFSQDIQDARNKALLMIEEINTFVRYHFQDNSVFADKVVEKGNFPTACSDTLGIRQKLNISGGNDQLVVQDRLGQSITVDANDATHLSNQLTRDYVFTTEKTISTSSFATVHEVSTPLSTHFNYGQAGKDNGRYDFAWTQPGAASRMKLYRKKFEDYLWKRYIKD